MTALSARTASGPAVRVGLMDSWTIDVPYLPKSGNRQRRQHWAVSHRERLQILDAIVLISRALRVPLTGTVLTPLGERRHPMHRRGVQIEFVKPRRGGRNDDPSNLHERTKHVLDALKTAGLIVDDSDRWIDYQQPTERRAEPGETANRTIITLTQETSTP